MPCHVWEPLTVEACKIPFGARASLFLHTELPAPSLRRYGVRSAMPGFIGKRLCAEKGVELRFVSGDMKSYQHYAGISRQVRDLALG